MPGHHCQGALSAVCMRLRETNEIKKNKIETVKRNHKLKFNFLHRQKGNGDAFRFVNWLRWRIWLRWHLNGASHSHQIDLIGGGFWYIFFLPCQPLLKIINLRFSFRKEQKANWTEIQCGPNDVHDEKWRVISNGWNQYGHALSKAAG